MINEYLTLYAIADNFAYHFISNDKAILNEKNEIIFIKNPASFEDEERKIYNLLIAIHKILMNIGEEGVNIIKTKYNNILKGLEKDRQFNKGFIPLFIGLAMLELYTDYSCKRYLNIKKKTVKKRIDNIRKKTGLNLLDTAYLNSILLGEKLFNKINGLEAKKCN